MDHEARVRQIMHERQSYPENAYARANLDTIAAREIHTAKGLRAVEQAYRTAMQPQPAAELSQLLSSAHITPNYEAEIG
jgi:hypothetical protein